MKLIPINILSAVIFPFVFSACVSQSSVDFNKQRVAKARGMSEETVKAIVDKAVEKPFMGIFGTEKSPEP